MKVHRIYGIVLRYMYYFRHSLDRLSDAFYWPTIDLLIWGLTSTYVTSVMPGKAQFITMVISGLLLWIIVWRGQYEITVNLLSELWDRNLLNIFISPLKFSEWLISFIILGVVKAIISLSFAMIVAYILYKVQILFYGLYLLPFLFLLIMTGWWVGFFVAGIIIRYGTKMQMLAWSMVAVLSPFSAIFYPLSILPKWAQEVALFVPTSYIFEASRQLIAHGSVDGEKLYISLFLNCIYLVLSIWYLKSSFKKILQRGLANLE